MWDFRKNGQTSNVIRFKILDSSKTYPAGLTGLSSASTGLVISTIADIEATATAYTVAGSTIETITTLGTYAAPTATKCRFKEVDATNHPGLYEFQFADARFAVSGAKQLTISVSGSTTNLIQSDITVMLSAVDPADAVHFGLSALPNAAAAGTGGLMINGANTGAMTESYAALHSAPTINQILFEIRAFLAENAVSGTTVTIKKIDGSTTAETFTIDSSTSPAEITRAS